MRYLTRRWERDILFEREKELKFAEYSDFYWVGDHINRKSILRFVFVLNRGFISYALKKQAVVNLSSTKMEYVALSLAAQKAMWLQLLLTKLRLLTPSKQFAKVYVYKNNKCAEAILFSSIQDKSIPK